MGQELTIECARHVAACINTAGIETSRANIDLHTPGNGERRTKRVEKHTAAVSRTACLRFDPTAGERDSFTEHVHNASALPPAVRPHLSLKRTRPSGLHPDQTAPSSA